MKLVSTLIIAGLLLGTHSFAKPHDHGKKNKMHKSKKIPYGLQKKLQRGGELPPGWQKKLRVGGYLSDDILSRGVIVNPREISDLPEPSYSKIYKIEDKIIRVNRITNVILDILK